MRKSLQDIYDVMFGKRVFIVGGGYSLHGFNFSRLDNEIVVAINSSYKSVPNAFLIYWVDSYWITRNERTIKALPAIKVTSKRGGTTQDNYRARGNSILLRNTGINGIDLNPDCVRGNNSGTEALNLCVNMGAKEIVLLGFDMCHVGSKSHHHNDYKTLQTASSSVYKGNFLPSISSMGEEIKQHRPEVSVINCSMQSAITCFPKVEFDALGRFHG